MKLTLGITFTLLLILQTFQQVSADIPQEWEREAAGSYFPSNGNQQPQNSTELDLISDKSGNETEESSSEGPESTTPPPMIALNSSSEISAESNETQTHETATNSSTAEHNHDLTPNDTKTTPKPEANNTDSNSDDSGSGFLPSDDLPTNSTTESPTTTTKDVNKTTVNATEPPLYPTSLPPAITEDITTFVPESEDMTEDPTREFENRENSGRGSGSAPVQNGSDNKNKAWAVVLIVGIVVGVIALTAFIVLNRKNRRDFSHRKLEEETSPDPVLRLDNSEPLDLNGFGYYNSGLEADNIQMTNFPQGRSK